MDGDSLRPKRQTGAARATAGARVLVPLERRESTREPARLISAVLPDAAVRVRALHVASVVLPLSYFPPQLGVLDTLRLEQLGWEASARRALERQARPLGDAGFALESEVAAGSPLSELLKRATLWRADLILARPRRERGARGGLGSVAAGLMQAAPAPVLLFRGVPARFRVRRILAAVDFSAFSRRGLEWALVLAALTGADVRILHVLPEGGPRWAPRLRRSAATIVAAERRRAKRFLGRLGSAATSVEGALVERGDPGRAILEARRDGIDLVVLGASGKTGIAAVLGSVARRVVRESPGPVLVVPATSRVSALELYRRVRGRPPQGKTPSSR